jgi:predicted GH43/DUF377 family glycosyl hydrolase
MGDAKEGFAPVKRILWKNWPPHVAYWGETDTYSAYTLGCPEGWKRDKNNPIVHINYRDVGNPCVIKVKNKYYMFFDWIGLKRITFSTSDDGVHWCDMLQLSFHHQPGWGEHEVMHPSVIYKDGQFEMWYTVKQYPYEPLIQGKSVIKRAISKDALDWEKTEEACLEPEDLWEENSVQYPHVMWDASAKKYRMWYSAGEYDVPVAIGYAESPDGDHWERVINKPVLQPDHTQKWEHYAVNAGCVFHYDNKLYMLYDGYENPSHVRQSLARSQDGISWEKYQGPPLFGGGKQGWWDCSYITKTCILKENGLWRMWYTGHGDLLRNIGLMTCEGENFLKGGWDKK